MQTQNASRIGSIHQTRIAHRTGTVIAIVVGLIETRMGGAIVTENAIGIEIALVIGTEKVTETKNETDTGKEKGIETESEIVIARQITVGVEVAMVGEKEVETVITIDIGLAEVAAIIQKRIAIADAEIAVTATTVDEHHGLDLHVVDDMKEVDQILTLL